MPGPMAAASSRAPMGAPDGPLLTSASRTQVFSLWRLIPPPAAPPYAGSVGGGVFKSADAGASWTAVNFGLQNASVFALAIDPVNPAMLYAGTFNGGVFKSADGGAIWSAINSGLTSTFVRA